MQTLNLKPGALNSFGFCVVRVLDGKLSFCQATALIGKRQPFMEHIYEPGQLTAEARLFRGFRGWGLGFRI